MHGTQKEILTQMNAFDLRSELGFCGLTRTRKIQGLLNKGGLHIQIYIIWCQTEHINDYLKSWLAYKCHI